MNEKEITDKMKYHITELSNIITSEYLNTITSENPDKSELLFNGFMNFCSRFAWTTRCIQEQLKNFNNQMLKKLSEAYPEDKKSPFIKRFNLVFDSIITVSPEEEWLKVLDRKDYIT